MWRPLDGPQAGAGSRTLVYRGARAAAASAAATSCTRRCRQMFAFDETRSGALHFVCNVRFAREDSAVVAFVPRSPAARLHFLVRPVVKPPSLLSKQVA